MDVKEMIRDYITENFLLNGSGYDLPDNSSFIDEGIIDSTGTLELVMFVEEEFDFEVADDEIEPRNFDSVDNLATYIARKRIG